MKKQVDTTNALIAPRKGNYVETLESIVAGGFCPFCEEHFFKHHKKPILCSTKHWLVTENSWPYDGLQHHVLFIAREHVERTEHLSPEAWADLHRLYRLTVKQRSLEGASLFIRSGETKITGATVNHLHAQVIVGIPRGEDTEPIQVLLAFKEKT